ncbi:MFS transporter [Nonomuraea ferruginea]|uniref:MFS transporter n=1 Tax=Nonomuraea ferruginea TaxID=46174 RepID=A0ABT4T5N4_9ACTN|nr:MFS transporter [Nonomuraea ferruginea]MDA0644817.1 MFS transporter [Nonomuraea ferruginea]
MSTRAPAWLAALTFTMFTFATDDYVIAGVLPALSRDLGVSEAVGGQLVTGFSLAFALTAPVASVVTASWPRRGLMTGALLLFVAANGAAALVTSYPVLMGLRVLAAVAAAAVVPAAYAITASQAPAGRQGRYLALVMGGLTGSLMLGVPIGTWVGGAFGWRATFVLAALLGLVSLVAVRRTLPRVAPDPAEGSLRDRLAPLARPQVVAGLLGIVAIVLGSMMVMTYLAPFLRELAGAGPVEVGWVFVLAGAAGFAGGQLGGRAGDRWGADRALIAGICGFGAVMAAFTVVWGLRPLALLALLPLLALWAGVSWWIPPPAQVRLLALAGPAGPQALALNSSAVYVGVSGGGALGGVVLEWHGPGLLPAAAAVVEVVALVLFWQASRLGRPAVTSTVSRTGT